MMTKHSESLSLSADGFCTAAIPDYLVTQLLSLRLNLGGNKVIISDLLKKVLRDHHTSPDFLSKICQHITDNIAYYKSDYLI